MLNLFQHLIIHREILKQVQDDNNKYGKLFRYQTRHDSARAS